MNSQAPEWPPLSDFTVVTGRAATDHDVSVGHAVFVLKASGQPIGEAITIPLPQYAMHLDSDNGKRSSCILIQAEHAGGQAFGGAVMLPDRGFMAGMLSEFELFESP